MIGLTGTTSNTELTGEYVDPLSQSFVVDDQTGVFITSVDVFFRAKPLIDTTPVTCQLRTVDFGTPTKTILPYSSVDVTKNDHHFRRQVFLQTLSSRTLSIWNQEKNTRCIPVTQHRIQSIHLTTW